MLAEPNEFPATCVVALVGLVWGQFGAWYLRACCVVVMCIFVVYACLRGARVCVVRIMPCGDGFGFGDESRPRDAPFVVTGVPGVPSVKFVGHCFKLAMGLYFQA